MNKGQRIEFLRSENDINCLVEAKISSQFLRKFTELSG